MIGKVIAIADALRIERGKLVTTTVARLRGDPSDGPVADNVEADRAILETDIRLARDVEESVP
jgi:hypothetical protein